MWAQRASAADEEEHSSTLRAVFLYGALLATLIPVTQNALALIDRTFISLAGLDPYRAILGGSQTWVDNLIAILMNALAAAYFVSVLRRDWATLSDTENFADIRRLYRYLWLALQSADGHLRRPANHPLFAIHPIEYAWADQPRFIHQRPVPSAGWRAHLVLLVEDLSGRAPAKRRTQLPLAPRRALPAGAGRHGNRPFGRRQCGGYVPALGAGRVHDRLRIRLTHQRRNFCCPAAGCRLGLLWPLVASRYRHLRRRIPPPRTTPTVLLHPLARGTGHRLRGDGAPRLVHSRRFGGSPDLGPGPALTRLRRARHVDRRPAALADDLAADAGPGALARAARVALPAARWYEKPISIWCCSPPSSAGWSPR